MALQFMTRAPDGRTLEVYVDGPAAAAPLLFHNGTPSSGQLYAPFVEAVSQRGLRMVSFSRAGYGSSTRNPGRRVADVAPDVAAVLDQVGAQRFYTLGWSGGGPHALACAALLPARVIGAATVGGLAPYDAEGLDWMAGMGRENVAVFGAALAGDAALRTFLEDAGSSLATVTPDEVAARLGESVSEVDRAAISGESAAWLADVFRESLRNGIWGWYDDELALSGRGASTSVTSMSRWRSGRGRKIAPRPSHTASGWRRTFPESTRTFSPITAISHWAWTPLGLCSTTC